MGVETREEAEEEHESGRRGEDVRGDEKVLKRKRSCCRLKHHTDRGCGETAARISRLRTFDLVKSERRRGDRETVRCLSLSV